MIRRGVGTVAHEHAGESNNIHKWSEDAMERWMDAHGLDSRGAGQQQGF